MKTTLNKIYAHKPCPSSWRKLLDSLGKTKADDTEVSIEYILDLLGLDDALWALRAVEGHDRELRLFACDCAERVLHIFESYYNNDNRPRNAIEVARKYANGDATIEERAASEAATGPAARDAARAAALAARYAQWAARDARYEARDAARAAALAARYAAGDAARDAARDAALAARYAQWAARDARYAAWDEAWDAGREWQGQRLRQII